VGEERSLLDVLASDTARCGESLSFGTGFEMLKPEKRATFRQTTHKPLDPSRGKIAGVARRKSSSTGSICHLIAEHYGRTRRALPCCHGNSCQVCAQRCYDIVPTMSLRRRPFGIPSSPELRPGRPCVCAQSDQIEAPAVATPCIFGGGCVQRYGAAHRRYSIALSKTRGSI
jgi:hypothetical protein